MTEAKELKGTIEQISFHNKDNGYCVLKVNTSSRLVTLTARLPIVSIGEEVHCQGAWVIHPKFGEQFQASRIVTQPPSHLKLIEKHLSSGIIKGIRKISAEKLVKAFGEKTLQVLEETVQKNTKTTQTVQKILGASGKNWQKIKRGISEYLNQYKQHETERLWLTGLGLGVISIQKLLKTYGKQTIETLQKNPYLLIERVRGFGFKVSFGV